MILAPELVVKIPVKKVKKEKPFFFRLNISLYVTQN